MLGTVIDYAIRSMLALAGIGNIALAAADATDGILIKILVLMSGIITLLMSIFFTGFMVHLANHSKDRKILFEEINNRLNEIKDAVCPHKTDKEKAE